MVVVLVEDGRIIADKDEGEWHRKQLVSVKWPLARRPPLMTPLVTYDVEMHGIEVTGVTFIRVPQKDDRVDIVPLGSLIGKASGKKIMARRTRWNVSDIDRIDAAAIWGKQNGKHIHARLTLGCKSWRWWNVFVRAPKDMWWDIFRAVRKSETAPAGNGSTRCTRNCGSSRGGRRP